MIKVHSFCPPSLHLNTSFLSPNFSYLFWHLHTQIHINEISTFNYSTPVPQIHSNNIGYIMLFNIQCFVLYHNYASITCCQVLALYIYFPNFLSLPGLSNCLVFFFICLVLYVLIHSKLCLNSVFSLSIMLCNLLFSTPTGRYFAAFKLFSLSSILKFYDNLCILFPPSVYWWVLAGEPF